MPTEPDDADIRARLEPLLSAAVAASVFSIHGAPLALEQVRPWAASNTTARHLLDAEVPQREAADLKAALASFLEPYIRPDTGHLGFAPYDVIGGTLLDVTIDQLVTGMVAAAALLGTRDVVSPVCAWADGTPGTYVQTWVLRGLDVPEPLELVDGVRFERLPDAPNDLFDHMEDLYDISARELARQPVLRLDVAIDPMFYRPTLHGDPLDRITRTRRTVLKATASPGALNTNQLLDAVSLVCGRSVQVLYEWNEYPEVMRLVRTGSQVGPFMHNVPKYRSPPSGPALTAAHLDQVRTVARQMKGRSDLDIAVARWKNSSVVMDAGNRIIDLRTVVECLYAQGAGQELALRTALCGAWHLAPTAEERSSYYGKFSKLYGAASRVVHGRKPRDDQADLVHWAHDACRRAILKRLAEPGDLDWTAMMLGLPQPAGNDSDP